MAHYIATADIPFGEPGRGVYAFRAGDRVPAELVDANGWGDYVARPASKKAQAAVADASGDPADSTPKKAPAAARKASN